MKFEAYVDARGMAQENTSLKYSEIAMIILPCWYTGKL